MGRGRGRRTDRGQSETIGVVLLLAITILGTTAIVAFGATALDSAKLTSQREASGHAMTQFDSRAALAALGDSDVQEFDLGNSGQGSYHVDSDAGWINITHYNYSGNDDEPILNRTMGSVVYENGDTVIAYQGGGVWRKSGNGSVMVSPPEFHYRSATLTFPLIRVEGSGGVSGSVRGRVVNEESAHRIFPNESDEYDIGTSNPYHNPIENGTVYVTVHSQYYQAWADYFRTRSSGNVTVHHNNDTVVLELIALGTLGDFEMPAEGNAIEVRGLGGGHPLEEFNITIYPDDEDSADFSNLQWSLYAEEGGQQFEIHIRDNSGGTCGDSVRATVYYSENNGADYQSWTSGSAFQYECGTFGDYDIRLIANFTSQTPMDYEPVKGDDSVIMAFSVSGSDDFISTTNFDEHESTVSWEPEDFSEGETTSLDNVTNHYLEQMGPNVDVIVDDKSSNTVTEEDSTGTLEQEGGGGKFLTFLHITENRIRVEFE